MYNQDDTEFVPVVLPNGATVKVEIAHSGRQDVAVTDFLFKPVMEIIEGLAQSLTEALTRFKPDKATLNFGLEMAVESGGLTALIVKGAGKGNLQIGLEWSGQNLKEKQDDQRSTDQAAQ